MLRSLLYTPAADEKVLEVKSTPENLKYIKISKTWRYLGRPFTHRLAWLGALLLAVGAAIPLTLKALANLFISPLQAGKNLAAAIGIPIGLGIVSAINIVFPTFGRSLLMKWLVIPAGVTFAKANKVPKGVRPIKEEVGPKLRVASEQTAVMMVGESIFADFKGQVTVALPALRSYPEVKGLGGIVIDSVDIPLQSPEKKIADKVSRYRLYFCPNAGFYQNNFSQLVVEGQRLKCHTRAFNYPGVTKSDNLDSLYDVINAGIAQIYDLAKRNNWTNADIEKNLHLYGHCWGGAIAAQVAAYFKEKHQVNIKIFVDRSFLSLQSATAGFVNRECGLPLWYAKRFCAAIFFGGGEINLDSYIAVKKLDPSKVAYINLGHKNPPSVASGFLQKIKIFLGLGKPSRDADNVIVDGATLADGLEHEKSTHISSSGVIVNHLKAQDSHRVYTVHPSNMDHGASLSSLYLDKKVTDTEFGDYYYHSHNMQNRTGFSYYERVIDGDAKPATPQCRL
ncbi:MAG: hypothetical protein ACYCQI_10080 [Gammaproteobacteria bacterium]